MLSKMLMRGAQAMLTQPAGLKKLIVPCTVRQFRADFKNPYKYDPVELTDVERKKQEALPVWDRVFDFKKYMQQEGPLKVANTHFITQLIVVNWYCFLRC